MPETYKDAVKQKQEQTPEEEEHLAGMPNYAEEVEGEVEETQEEIEERLAGLEDISITPPGRLSGVQDRSEFDVPQPGESDPTSGLGIGDINIGELSELDNQQILEVLVRVNIAMLNSLLNIEDYTSSYSNITVSGTNAINAADTPEPVVPQSDQSDIPTRILGIRSDTNNTDSIAFGDDQVSPNNGFVLNRGEVKWMEIDLRGEALFMSSETEGQIVQLLGMV